MICKYRRREGGGVWEILACLQYTCVRACVRVRAHVCVRVRMCVCVLLSVVPDRSISAA